MTYILNKPLILIDGSSYLYRAYNAFPNLKNSKGELTSAIYGVLRMIRALIIKYQPTHAAIVFDNKSKNFRNKLFKDYKINRTPMPDSLKIQIKPLHKIIKAMGLSLIMASDVEADDIIGTISCMAEKSGHKVLIVTNDKDMIQLITSRITLLNTTNNIHLGIKEVINKYGILPRLIIDLIALAGDSSDNIPGIPGIGNKTALFLLKNIGGLDSIYKKIEQISNLDFRNSKLILSKLKQNKEIAYLSRQLATIKKNVGLNLNYKQLKIKKTFNEELLYLFKKYEFKNWIPDVESGTWLKR